MKSISRSTVWFCLIGLVCLTLMSCQLMQAIVEEPTPTPPPTQPPPPTEAPTQPLPPTETPLPLPTEAPTAIPSPTLPPPPTAVPPTDTPASSQVTVVNNLSKPLTISIAKPANITFTVNARSTYTFEIAPGT
jgi:cytoskeletal protein RodZ